MECINRLYSYLTKSLYVKALSLDCNLNNNHLYAVIQLFNEDNKINLKVYDIVRDIKRFIEENSLFEFLKVSYKNKEVLINLFNNNFVCLTLHLVNEYSNDYMINNVYNPNKLLSTCNYSYDILVESLNNIILEFSNFIILNKKDKIQSFTTLLKINDEILSFMFAFYLKKCYKSEINELYSVLPKEIKKNYDNYLSILSVNRVNECAKMMIWFINDFINNIPIIIAPRINIDFYFEVKKKILNL